jgi:hypothetical protein
MRIDSTKCLLSEIDAAPPPQRNSPPEPGAGRQHMLCELDQGLHLVADAVNTYHVCDGGPSRCRLASYPRCAASIPSSATRIPSAPLLPAPSVHPTPGAPLHSRTLRCRAMACHTREPETTRRLTPAGSSAEFESVWFAIALRTCLSPDTKREKCYRADGHSR